MGVRGSDPLVMSEKVMFNQFSLSGWPKKSPNFIFATRVVQTQKVASS